MTDKKTDKNIEHNGDLCVGDVIPAYIVEVFKNGLLVNVRGVKVKVPINEIKYGWIDSIQSEYKVGSQIFVRINEIIKKGNGSIEYVVSGKDAQLDPWGKGGFVEGINVGDIVSGQVTGVDEHIVFVRLADGVDALIRPIGKGIKNDPYHKEKLSNGSTLSYGDIVDVKVREIDLENKKVYARLHRLKKKSLIYKW